MTASDLRKLVERGEGQNLEFKKKADHPEKIVRELVAFANSGSGILLLGVEDNGNIAGLPFPEEDRYVMEAAIHKFSKPSLKYEMELIQVGRGGAVLKYYIPEGTEKPYFGISDKEKQTYSVYVRSRDQTLRASYEMFRILLRKEAELPVEIGPLQFLLLSELGKRDGITIREFSAISGKGKKK